MPSAIVVGVASPTGVEPVTHSLELTRVFIFSRSYKQLDNVLLSDGEICPSGVRLPMANRAKIVRVCSAVPRARAGDRHGLRVGVADHDHSANGLASQPSKPCSNGRVTPPPPSDCAPSTLLRFLSLAARAMIPTKDQPFRGSGRRRKLPSRPE